MMSVFNERPEWMAQSIDSILNQSFTDFEFIIINDNPARIENRHILDSYSQKDSRIVVLMNEQNIGLTQSLNRGISISKGEYIVRMDADDYSFPTRIEKQVLFMDNHTEIVASGCYARLMNEEGKDIGSMSTGTDINTLKALFPFRTPIYHPSAIIRRIINNNIVQYDEKFRYSQDYALWFNLIDLGISNIPEYLIKYRLSNHQISSVHQNTMKNLDVMVRFKALKKFYLGLNDNEYNLLISLYYRVLHKTDNEQIMSTLITLYENNRDNNELNLKAGSKLLFSLYCHYLAKNFSLPRAFFYGYRMKRELHVKNYRSLLALLK